MLVAANESIGNIKKYEELWSKIRDLIRSITKTQMIAIKNIRRWEVTSK